MARTIDEGFNALLTKLSPLDTEHKKGRSHKGAIEGCLTNRFDLYKLFETGSFGNGTGIRHHSDTDYFAVLSSQKVSSNSAITLRRTKEGLCETFIRTRGIEVKSPAVSVPFGKYRSETLEITPCVYAGMINKYPAYRIPDGSGGWLLSSPVAHNHYVRDIDAQLNGKLKPLIQLVKAWKYYHNVPIRSFYLELFTARHLAKRRRLDLPLDLYKLFIALYEHELDEFNDPMGITLGLASCNTDTQRETAMSRLATATGRALKAIEAEQRGRTDIAYTFWKKLFNYEFPTYR